jgi:HlyD family secretion protein
VQRADLQAKVTANGKVQAQRKVDISATIPGQITHLAVREGDRVTKGQFLLQLDPVSPARHRAQQRGVDAGPAPRGWIRRGPPWPRPASTSRGRRPTSRRASFRRWTCSVRARTVATAQAAVSAAERRVEQARAMLEGAQDTLSKTVVRSPIDGIVTAKRVEEGRGRRSWAFSTSRGRCLLTISDMSVVEAEVEVDETSIPSVKVEQEALVRVDAYPNRTFTGVVTEVGNSPILARDRAPPRRPSSSA